MPRTRSGIEVGCRLRARLAGEGQQLARQGRRPLGEVHDVLQKLAHGRAGVFLAQRQRGIAVDAGQQIVELVGHAAGQGADALHFLGLEKLPLQLLMFGHVAVDADEMRWPPIRIDNGRNRQRSLKLAAVLAAVGQLALPAVAGQDGAPQ